MDPNKKITFPVLDAETNEITVLEMDEESYLAMLAAEKEQEEQEKVALKEQQEEHWRALRWATRRYVRDDD
jgi:hypothetical protein